jgi:protease-4
MKKRTWPWVVGVLVVLLMFSCCGCLVVGLLASRMPGRGAAGGVVTPGTVAVIEVHGTIVSGDGSTGLGTESVAYSKRIIRELDEATKNPRIAAIVLDVDSPGGSVVASADIHRALLECPKPLVTSMGETAASGGYYIACGTQYVMARPATLTGSIGVRWEFTDASVLLEKLGIDITSIKSGAFKDQGSIARPLSQQEVAMLQAIIDEAYDDFVQVVAEGRNLPEDEVRSIADGRVLSGRQAMELGLVDAEGNLDDAIAKAATLGGIEGEPEIYYYQRVPSLWDLLGGFTMREEPAELALLGDLLGDRSRPTLQYLYRAD